MSISRAINMPVSTLVMKTRNQAASWTDKQYIPVEHERRAIGDASAKAVSSGDEWLPTRKTTIGNEECLTARKLSASKHHVKKLHLLIDARASLMLPPSRYFDYLVGKLHRICSLGNAVRREIPRRFDTVSTNGQQRPDSIQCSRPLRRAKVRLLRKVCLCLPAQLFKPCFYGRTHT